MEIRLPSLSAGMEDAVIARWLKAEGDSVAKGEVLAEVETDKATMELEAEADGVIGRLLVADGARAEVNDVIALLLLEGEDATALKPELLQPAAEPDAVPSPATILVQADTSAAVERGTKIAASPLARRLAESRGLALDAIIGSGPRGRIVRLDVDRASEKAASVLATTAAATTTPTPSLVGIGEYDEIPISNMRRVIAHRLLEAKTTVPHFYLEADCNIEALLELREQINATREKSDRISVNDFVIKAVALALREVPEANSIWTEDAILRLRSVDISVAVATEAGLMTPILRAADRKSIGTISAEIKMLAQRARDGKLAPEEYQGGGFSVSNLGMFGVKSFAAIINPPQSCILAVGAAQSRPVGRDGQVVLAQVMSCTLSVDHRTTDGAVGALWLAAFKNAIETPMILLT